MTKATEVPRSPLEHEAAGPEEPADRPGPARLHLALTLGGLYALALVIRLVAAAQVSFPATEPAAYYADVARNLVAGEGLVSHAVWSYATAPLTVPKPAFELWLPMSSFVSALSMGLLGPTWWAAQVGSALLGALVAPLAWALARGAARASGLDVRRGAAVALASGLLACCLGPFVTSAAVPDSYTPFLVFSLVAALLVPPTLGIPDGARASPARRPRVLAGLALGVSLGLAYLARQEAIWVGLSVLIVLAWAAASRPRGARWRDAAARLWPIIIGGLLVTIPWLTRNSLTFGSPFPGQALENMVLVRNEDVFAFLERPSLARYLGQGLMTVVGNPLTAAWEGLREVLLLTAFPVGLAGLVALVAMRRSGGLRRPTALLVLLLSGGLTFLATVLLFPVATRWGTFLHASGPLLMALLVVATLGTDALLARISGWRGWQRPNVVIGPAAIVVLTALLAWLQVGFLAGQARETEARLTAIGQAVAAVASDSGKELPATLISDHPMWLADVLDRNVIALPDESPEALVELSRRFKAPWLLVIDGRGRHPEALLTPAARACLTHEPVPLEASARPARLFRLAAECPGA